ncbi:hypothetical protein COT95_02725 [Candidatus Falkowbacteria bacterium CG10_big_fil_rev_8_21_14_0_10_37_6]|uniref:Uncharacterized protein n=1 Tax=Candidatus Falkowbacteria bacterium CG10_big_fil_rev_8_21_14_0_10_37_6 TaxID=1974563 RepID=A0A2H0V6N7_9BACT|nr:MAG: hypothetical protein COT95_02725 [Candidatus Falkowbacteria bacterium CG10_big_fil_rev_8_21_14_0_10_37_6]
MANNAIMAKITNTFDGTKKFIVTAATDIEIKAPIKKSTSVTIPWQLWNDLGKPPVGVLLKLSDLEETKNGWRAKKATIATMSE